MKISILTATYNRANYLTTLYQSIISNLNQEISVEWLLMDDGSTDNTKTLIENFIKENIFTIKYYYQSNHGKMQALNNLVPHASGNLLVEIDSDDYFTNTAFSIITTKYKLINNMSNIYAMVFPRQMTNTPKFEFNQDCLNTTMFDLYFKYGFIGDTTMVFNTSIRKKYSHQLENNEKFITESRMYHKIDLNFKIYYFDEIISSGSYLETGYSKNITKEFINNSFGYFKYFQEILNFNMKNVLFKKRLYVIKHYILFSYLTKQKHIFKNIKGNFNKFLLFILFIPGYTKSWFNYRKV